MRAILLLATLAAIAGFPAIALPDGVERVLVLPPTEGNPRNSEGDFITLKDGRVAFVYTHFTDGADDFSEAHLAARFSSDGGKTWTAEDVEILPNEGGHNVMSVSLLRLQDERIALLYLRKNGDDECMPHLRYSSDEMATWTEPILCVPSRPGYYVVNNDRLVQLRSGRLVIPAALHALKGDEFRSRAEAMCLLSDDGGATWRFSKSTLHAPEEVETGLQEPGIVELPGGRLWMFCRTSAGFQFSSWSEDGGDIWTDPVVSDIASPTSPATVEVIPGTPHLLMAWNNHYGVTAELKGRRTPFTLAISKDEGRTWTAIRNLEENPHGWYCYTAMAFVEGHVLLGHCAGDRRENNGLALTQVLRVPLEWLNQQ